MDGPEVALGYLALELVVTATVNVVEPHGTFTVVLVVPAGMLMLPEGPTWLAAGAQLKV